MGQSDSIATNGQNISFLRPAIDTIGLQIQSSKMTSLALVLITSVIYYSLARLGLSLQFEQTQASAVWPPSGFALGITLLFGWRVLPGILIGAITANIADFFFKSGIDGSFFTYLFGHPKELSVSVAIGAGNSLEAIAGFVLLTKFHKQELFSSVQSIVFFAGVSLVACAISASVGVFSLAASGILPEFLWLPVWFTWWLGDVTGMLILVPVIYILAKGSTEEPNPVTAQRMLLSLLFLFLATGMTFLEWGAIPFLHAQAYLLLPVLCGIVFVTGMGTTTLAIVLVSGISVWGTINNLGPFVRADQNTSLILLQGFIGVMSITLLLLGTTLGERLKAQLELRRANDELEQRVKNRTRALEEANLNLERSNKELDDFSYIASHDLKEPLRGIDNQVTFIIEDHGDTLHPKVRERIDKLPGIVRHLEDLISTLLHFSRVGRQDLVRKKTDLSAALDAVLNSLSSRIEELGVEVRIPQPLPTIMCDDARVGEIFRNLITNAMKYNDKDEKWLEIGFEHKGNHVQFHVKDNGIGIRERHRDKIFTIFKRLHGRDKFGGGTGAGMTIVKKIVERHGGKIWLESEVGVGSSFYFTFENIEEGATE